jgi:hypothetical protein
MDSEPKKQQFDWDVEFRQKVDELDAEEDKLNPSREDDEMEKDFGGYVIESDEEANYEYIMKRGDVYISDVDDDDSGLEESCGGKD